MEGHLLGVNMGVGENACENIHVLTPTPLQKQQKNQRREIKNDKAEHSKVWIDKNSSH
jgi:hypothetical protein